MIEAAEAWFTPEINCSPAGAGTWIFFAFGSRSWWYCGLWGLRELALLSGGGGKFWPHMVFGGQFGNMFRKVEEWLCS